MTLSLILTFAIALGVSAFLTKLLHKYLLEAKAMDVPNKRSMHKVPVPRGGGLAIISVIIAGLLVYHMNIYLLPALFLLLIISFMDDKKGLPPSLRLFFHLLAATVGSYALGPAATLFGDMLPFWLDRAIIIVGWAWFMNLYNFMDGIDGITSVQTITCAIGFGLLAFLPGINMPHGPELAAVVAGASAGFLIFNWHPAKIFMGDVGSVTLGFIIGFLMLKIAVAGYLIPALLIPLYYLLDSGITITRRALRKEKIWEAHKEHYYQRATEAAGSPKPIVFSILVTNLCLVATAGIAIASPLLGGTLGAIVATALLYRLGQKPEKKKAK